MPLIYPDYRSIYLLSAVYSFLYFPYNSLARANNASFAFLPPMLDNFNIKYK
jgi:hypothetical protein